MIIMIPLNALLVLTTSLAVGLIFVAHLGQLPSQPPPESIYELIYILRLGLHTIASTWFLQHSWTQASIKEPLNKFVFLPGNTELGRFFIHRLKTPT